MQKISLQTRSTQEWINITPQIQKCLKERPAEEGICVIYCPHTTAGLTINENADPDVPSDLTHYLEKMIPRNYPGFRHAEGNSDGHLKSSLIGNSLNLIIHENKLVLGTWQGIYFCEFDGPRNREVFVKIMADKPL